MLERIHKIIFILVLINVSLAQEKFTLLNTSNDNVNVREIIVGRPTTARSRNVVIVTPATTKIPPTTKVPYKTLQCPPEPIRIPIFSLPCNHEKDCRVFGPNLACCKERCIKGVLIPAEAKTTAPVNVPKRAARISNEIVSPVLNQLPAITTASPKIETTSKKLELVCPSANIRLPFFSLPCSKKTDCNIFGRNLLCCRNVCLQGVAPPKEEVSHAPALFGLVDRHCPAQPLAELFDVKECETDADCLPRICCPEKNSLNRKSYCRTPIHNIERLPGAQRIQEPLRNFVSYMQCTPPPPRELFPKPCNNTLDCFPNLCCQESGKKFCRPPRRSLVALVADVTTRVGAAEATRRFIERITT
ncbi:uncharacterized protein [Atheta coriaria]|uniref:uncharacterized protein n=1 Tax=Dalotia coriaria TaxID=877792 RepID=UPI0031F44E9A